MWPRMIDGPSCPGLGEYRYQPAHESRPSGGTCTDRSGLIPSGCICESTPMAGISSLVGAAAGSSSPVTVAFGRSGVDGADPGDDRTGDDAIGADLTGATGTEAAAD